MNKALSAMSVLTICTRCSRAVATWIRVITIPAHQIHATVQNAPTACPIVIYLLDHRALADVALGMLAVTRVRRGQVLLETLLLPSRVWQPSSCCLAGPSLSQFAGLVSSVRCSCFSSCLAFPQNDALVHQICRLSSATKLKVAPS